MLLASKPPSNLRAQSTTASLKSLKFNDNMMKTQKNNNSYHFSLIILSLRKITQKISKKLMILRHKHRSKAIFLTWLRTSQYPALPCSNKLRPRVRRTMWAHITRLTNSSRDIAQRNFHQPHHLLKHLRICRATRSSQPHQTTQSSNPLPSAKIHSNRFKSKILPKS